jgi:OOP family OmpA-OmpF porin
MTMRLPYWSRYFVTLTLLGSGVLLSATIDSGRAGNADVGGRYSAVDPAELEINYLGGRLRVDGHSASRRHDFELQAGAASISANNRISLRPMVIAPDNWQALTAALLALVASSETANLSVGPEALRVRAVVADTAAWNTRLAAAAALLPDSLVVQANVISVQPLAADACVVAYRELSRQPVVFDRASATLRTSSYAALDRHADFAMDCGQYDIAITGHTDDRGDEAVNTRLSQARARAVANYLANRGVAESRLVASGAGSSRPIASNDTAWGRVRNRRIEFELLAPAPSTQ